MGGLKLEDLCPCVIARMALHKDKLDIPGEQGSAADGVRDVASLVARGDNN